MAKSVKCVKASQQAGFDQLVELHNGDTIKAFQEFEDNNFQIPARASALVQEDITDNQFTLPETEIETNPVIMAKEIALQKAKAAMVSKIRALDNTKHKGLVKIREQMESIMENIDEVEATESLVDFIKTANNLAKKSEGWMESFKSGEKTPTLENLRRIKDSIEAFTLLKDLREEMFSPEEVAMLERAGMENIEELFKVVDDTIATYAKVNSDYLRLSRKTLAAGLKGNFHKITRFYEKQAEAMFNRHKKPHLDKSEIAEEKAEFISKYMIAHATEIDLRTSQYIENMLLQTVDIPALSSWVVNPKDMNNDIIGIALESLDEADMEIWNQMETIVDDTEELNDEYIKYIGKTSNLKKQYEALLVKDEETGEVTPEMIHEGHPQFEAFKAKYENVPAVWNMYEHLKMMVEAKNKMVFKSARLDYTLPMIEQSGLERLYNTGVIDYIKKGVGDVYKLRAKDVELGNLSEQQLEQQEAKNKALQQSQNAEEVYITESGEERTTIPLHYRNSTIAMEDRSFDVMKTMILDYQNSLKFKVKTENAILLDVLKDVVHESDIIATTSFVQKLKKNKSTGHLHRLKDDRISNVESVLEALIRHRIYGIKIEGDPQTTKIFQSLGKYTSLVTMAANTMSGTANALHGATMSWIEAFAGQGGYFTPKQRAKAVKTYNKSIAGLLNDVGERRPKHRINKLMRKFNVMSESHLLNGKSFAQNNKLKRIAESSALMFANGAGEHAMQSIVMLSTMDNIKVKDVNGKFLDKDFNPTTDRNKAIGIEEAMIENEETGAIEFHPNVNSTEKTEGVSQKDITKISRYIRRINRDLYGNYDAENKARYQRNAVGSLGSQMRGWLVTGVQKRWRGIGTAGVLSKDYTKVGEKYDIDLGTIEGLHEAQKLSYNNEIDEFEEGQYVTSINYLKTAFSEVKALRSVAGTKEAWNKMDDQEKRNVRKTLMEAALIVGFLLMSKAFEDDDQDPDDVANMMAAYITRRMYSELFTFANPQEAMRTFRSPAIAMSSVENAIELTIQMFDPTEVYKGGRHVGEYKVMRKLKKLVPVVKQLDRNVEDSYLFLLNN
tara:strand:+ start:9977 stop:13180 length:3204 start_codon:yes stop_codon:yes gene_type:complete